MENKRIIWIDWAKSIGIFIVVLCHIPQYSTLEKSFFCSFQMPLFFLLSGYLYTVPQGGFKSTLKKYWTTLIIPYLWFQIIFFPYWLIVQKIDGYLFTPYSIFIKPVIDILIGIPINGVTWFIVALLIIKLYAYFILRLRYKWLWTSLSCLLIIGVRYIMYMNDNTIKISFAIDSMIHFFAFFFIGYYLKESGKMELIAQDKQKNNYLLFLSFFITLILVSLPRNSFFSQEPIHYVSGFSGSIFIITFCLIIKKFIHPVIYTISNGTIIIFGLHWMFIGTINFFVKKALGITGEIQYSTPTAIGIALFIVFLNYFIILFCKKHFNALLGYRK